ncbi:MAG: EI24 domain-containing protein [Burkholderiaceae bacterium]
MLKRVTQAFAQGARSQLEPAMLKLLLVPFAVAMLLWAVAAWFAWAPLVEWLDRTLFDSTGAMRWVQTTMARIGVDDFGRAASAVIALLLWVPLVFVSATVLIAVLAMPAVTRHLGQRDYADVARLGSAWNVLPSLWNASKAFALFMIGYLLTMPLWLIPPLAFVVPWLWWSWLTARLMRLDSLIEHADPAERRALIAAHRREYGLLGMMVCALNYVPPLFLITPVLSALVFTHYSLARLREQRAAPQRITDGIRPDHRR